MVGNTNAIDPYGLANLPVEQTTIDKIFAYERNTKVHSKEHIAKLRKSIEEQGLFDAIIVDRDGVIIAGHGRYQTLCEMGQIVVPVRWARQLTKGQADAARIAHNKTASVEYDSGFMAEELQRLSEEGFDLTALGLDQRELDMLLDDLGEVNIDAISTDLDQDIDDQEEETDAKVTATDASDEKLVKAMGFNAIPIAAVKDVRRWLADIQAETGKTGADAFVEWVVGR